MKLKSNVRLYRLLNNEMTQAELAKAIGVTTATIHSVEKAKFVPSTMLAFKIARFFNKPFEETFFVVEEEDDVKKQPDSGSPMQGDRNFG